MKKTIDTSKNVFKIIFEKTKLSPRMFAIVVLLLAGIVILCLSEIGTPKTDDEVITETTYEYNYREYETELETRLAAIISAIDGAGETKVMVTLESGSEQVYLNNSDYGENVDADGDNSFERKDDYVIVDNSSGQDGIIVRINEPKVRGVAIVCDGAGIESVKLQIVDAVTALLDISSAKVSVSKMN